MSGRYAPLPNPLAQDAEHEMDAAFGSDDEEDDDTRTETTPLNPHHTSPGTAKDPLTSAQELHDHDSSLPMHRGTIPGAYDFEVDPFDYAVPPPGSPPGPTSLAIPNQFGNSNGILPSAPTRPVRRGGFLSRTVGALLPSYYQRVPTEDATHAGPARGGGTNNDGVFANITAKPARGIVVQDGDSIHVVPEEAQKETPPSYAVAQADSAPAYYETIVHTPSGGLDGEVYMDSMPTGSIFTFAWTMLISLSFQFVGFLLTYLLHTTHAARFGSRAGLGITIIQYAFFLRRRATLASNGIYDENQDPQDWFGDANGSNSDGTSPPTPTSDFNSTITSPTNVYPGYFSSATTEWLSFFLMSAGWFILLTSLLGFWRVKRWERGIRQANESPAVPAEATEQAMERDRNIRANLLSVFGFPSDDEEGQRDVVRDPAQLHALRAEEERLARDMRASGLL